MYFIRNDSQWRLFQLQKHWKMSRFKLLLHLCISLSVKKKKKIIKQNKNPLNERKGKEKYLINIFPHNRRYAKFQLF